MECERVGMHKNYLEENYLENIYMLYLEKEKMKHKDIMEKMKRASAKNLEDGIDNRLLTAFKRIRKNARNGLAVVPIERNACSGCFSKVPPQRQLDIRQRKKIIVCENCGRIIVDHEITDE